jgi:regulator of nonsense transcripts 1
MNKFQDATNCEPRCNYTEQSHVQVIVFSTVRCNEEKHLGFVMDSRRMNVAITRAKRGLVVIGNEATLSSSIHWRSWLQYMREEQLVINKVLL